MMLIGAPTIFDDAFLKSADSCFPNDFYNALSGLINIKIAIVSSGSTRR